MEEHLGYTKSERSDNDDARNGYKSKRITSAAGSEIDLRAEDSEKTAEGHQRNRSKDHLDVCERNDYPVDF